MSRQRKLEILNSLKQHSKGTCAMAYLCKLSLIRMLTMRSITLTFFILSLVGSQSFLFAREINLEELKYFELPASFQVLSIKEITSSEISNIAGVPSSWPRAGWRDPKTNVVVYLTKSRIFPEKNYGLKSNYDELINNKKKLHEDFFAHGYKYKGLYAHSIAGKAVSTVDNYSGCTILKVVGAYSDEGQNYTDIRYTLFYNTLNQIDIAISGTDDVVKISLSTIEDSVNRFVSKLMSATPGVKFKAPSEYYYAQLKYVQHNYFYTPMVMHVVVRKKTNVDLRAKFEASLHLDKIWSYADGESLSGDEEIGQYAGFKVPADKYFGPIFSNKPTADIYLAYRTKDDCDVRVYFTAANIQGGFEKPLKIPEAEKYIKGIKNSLIFGYVKDEVIIYPPKQFILIADKIEKGEKLTPEDLEAIRKQGAE